MGSYWHQVCFNVSYGKNQGATAHSLRNTYAYCT